MPDISWQQHEVSQESSPSCRQILYCVTGTTPISTNTCFLNLYEQGMASHKAATRCVCCAPGTVQGVSIVLLSLETECSRRHAVPYPVSIDWTVLDVN